MTRYPAVALITVIAWAWLAVSVWRWLVQLGAAAAHSLSATHALLP